MDLARRCVLVALIASPPVSAIAQPPACGPGGAFPDVPQSHPFCAWIQQLAQDQIAMPCDGTNYCPDAPVTRAQLALFVYKLTRGTATLQLDADTLDGNDSSNFITGVTASGGLTGGGSSGDVDLSIADMGVDTAELKDNAVNTVKLADNAVTLSKMADTSVASAEILNNSVTSEDIANSTILFEDLGANGCASSNVIQRSGSSWACGTVALPTVFQHQVTAGNTSGNTSILNQASVNNKPAVKIFVTLDNTNFAGGAQVVAVKFVDLPDPLPDVWVLENMSAPAALPLNAIYNVLVFP